jgi:CDP-2,3-bis-(O-geranylgeranyl)-sn-glycerol synthase
MQGIENLISLIIFVLPAYFANAAPVAFSFLSKKSWPMDFKIKFFDKRRIFGKGKTWTGFFIGIFSGTLAGILIFFLGFRVYEFPLQVFVAFLLSLGALVGDVAGAFLKRRFSIGSGKILIFVDQTFFLIFALLFAAPFLPNFFDIKGFVFLLIFTFILHIATNTIAYKLGIKKVPY